MVKRVFIVHYWHGNPDGCWYPWLKGQLEKKGYKVFIPKMPDTDNPNINKWVSHLKKAVGKPDKDTSFIGHSIGCQAIMRYIESINTKDDIKIAGIFFVAGWLSLSPVVTDSEEGPIARPWLDTKIDFKKTTSSTKNITALFSSNDPYVPSENVKLFKELLNAKTLVEKDMGHYDDDSGTTKIPVMLKYF